MKLPKASDNQITVAIIAILYILVREIVLVHIDLDMAQQEL